MHRWLGALVLATTLLAGCGLMDPVIIPAAPPVDCRGVPAQTCRHVVSDTRAQARGPGVVPVAIRVACTRAVCADQEGEAQIDVRYSDGSEDHYTMGWSGAVDEPGQGRRPAPTPSLPIEPTCEGVPVQPCHDNAFVGLANGGMAPEALEVTSIVVVCLKGSCTDEAGTGTTTVTYVDGTTNAADWSYESGTGVDDPGSD